MKDMFRPVSYIFTALMICLVTSPAMAGESGPSAGSPAGIEYSVTIQTNAGGEVQEILQQISDSAGLSHRPPLSMAQLERRARSDVEEFQRAMRSLGYYDPEISYDIQRRDNKAALKFQVNSGPEYIIREVDLKNVSSRDVPLEEIPLPDEPGIEKGTRIRSAAVLDGAESIARSLKNLGYPFVGVEPGRVLIDHETRGAEVTYNIDPGPRAVFGQTEITGLKRVSPEFIRERLAWKQGQKFDARLMDDMRRKLTSSGLFTLVEVTHGSQVNEQGILPMQIRISERKPRTVRTGLGYQSDTGFDFKFSWVHRNLRGMGENLEFVADVSEIDQLLEGTYIIPSFRRADQKLTLMSGYLNEDKEGFKSRSVFASAVADRSLSRSLSAGLGVGYRLARVKQFGKENDLALLFFPLELNYDDREDILDPGTGFRYNLQFIPFLDTLDLQTRFIKARAVLNTYLELVPDKKIVLATRLAAGTITTDDKSRVPPDERFYAGGGGSIRGYAYQKAGTLEDDKPVGGLSLVEISNELRFRLSRRSGLVLFLDGGRAYDQTYPEADKQLYWGCGVGYRFYTDFAPIRADIAFPLNPRKGVDSDFHVYVSLGQAF